MNYQQVGDVRFYSLFLSVIVIFSSCNRLSDEDKQKLFMATLAASQDAPLTLDTSTLTPPSKNLPASSVKGMPGFCGDGIINGDEYCDGTTMADTRCETFNGLSGDLRCKQDCKLDISNCMTPAIDQHIGGLAETCKCNCAGNRCEGGCATMNTTTLGASRCQYRCDQDCICNCGALLQGHVERCDFDCTCTTDGIGNPQCDCAQNQCELLVSTKPNIGVIAAQKLRSPMH